MRFLLLNLFIVATIYAKNFGIVIIDNNKCEIKDSLKFQIEALFIEQSKNYIGKNNLEVFIDRKREVKKLYTRFGTKKLIEYAISKNYDTIAIVEYKKSSKFLAIIVVVVDEKVQDKKSKLITFHSSLSDKLTKTILSNVLTLNYELGVLNVKTIY